MPDHNCQWENKGDQLNWEPSTGAGPGDEGLGSCVKDEDYRGDDLRRVKDVLNFHDCDILCEEEVDCSFFTWSNSQVNPPNTCFLKTGFGSKVPMENVVSGMQGCSS